MVSSEQQNISYPKSKYLKYQIVLSFYDEDTPFLSKWVHSSNVFQPTNLFLEWTSDTETEWELKSRLYNGLVRSLSLCTFHPCIEESNGLGKCVQIS